MSSPDVTPGTSSGHRAFRGGRRFTADEAADLVMLAPATLNEALKVTDPGPSAREERLAAGAATAALHREIAKVMPELPGWKVWKTAAGVEIDRQILLLAAEERHVVPLDEGVYRVAMECADLTRSQQTRLWQMYNRAVALHAAAVKPAASSPEVRGARRRLAASMLDQESRSFTMRELEFVDTEAGFIAHLNVLKDRAGLASRPLHKAMTEQDPKITPGHSTLAGWLKGKALPAAAGEKVIRLLVEVLLEHIGDIPDRPQAVAEHLRVWRALIADRHIDGLLGPSRLAMQKLEVLIERSPQGKAKADYRTGLQQARLVIRDSLASVRAVVTLADMAAEQDHRVAG